MARVLITSALPYINGIKHLGNLVGSMLPADVLARYRRQRGDDVLFVCATDEHGTPAELAAADAGQSVEQYCREQYEIQSDIYRRFHLSFDEFSRSSSADNHELTQHLARKLKDHDLIEERTITQLYSKTDGRFLPDRYVVGTCPNCGYDRARGDQCENCTKLLDPTDLIEPRSAISGATDLELVETKHLYLLQAKMAGAVDAWVDSKQAHWPNLTVSIAKKWLNEGLHARGITRDLHWGVPVDWPGFEGKVFYVWFDAPIAYIAATKSWGEADPKNRDWKSWWYEADDVTYYQVMGKDNVPFHTISFPITLMGSGEPWKRVDFIKSFNWLTYYGGKFSTSQKRGVFTDQALEEFPADMWRYWLMANAPESADSSFTFERFAEQVNKDLAHTLGNFVNRVMKFCNARFGAAVPEMGALTAEDEAMVAELGRLMAEYRQYQDDLEYRKALASLRAIWVLGNEYLQSAAPWTAIKTDEARAKTIVTLGLGLARLYAVLSWSVIPETAETLLTALGEPVEGPPAWPGDDVMAELMRLPAGRAFTVPPVLFQPIDDDRVAGLVEKFGGEPG